MEQQRYLKLLWIFLLSTVRADEGDEHTTEVTSHMEDLFRNHAYELSLRPNKNGNSVTVVGVAVWIESITDISEVNMDATFTLHMRQTWRDYRLKFDTNETDVSLVLPGRLIENLWIPDMFIAGSKLSFVHKTTTTNQMLRLHSDGTIVYTAKLTVTVACHMNLYYFPLDKENCSIILQSLGHDNSEVILEWTMGSKRSDIFMDLVLINNMPKFHLESHRLIQHNVSGGAVQAVGLKNKTSSISQLQVTFELKRYLISVFFQSYFPALTVVILAGMSTLLDPNSAPARVAMGITAVLTISTIISGLKSTLPKISYLTAMDLYLWVSFFFVFSTVLEYCIINYIMTKQRNEKMKEKSAQERILHSILKLQENGKDSGDMYGMEKDIESMRTNIPDTVYNKRPKSFVANNNNSTGPITQKQQDDIASYIRNIEAHFIVLYFLSFVLFNLTYWIYYSTISAHNDEYDE